MTAPFFQRDDFAALGTAFSVDAGGFSEELAYNWWSEAEEELCIGVRCELVTLPFGEDIGRV
jgi:hypothetical protein